MSIAISPAICSAFLTVLCTLPSGICPTYTTLTQKLVNFSSTNKQPNKLLINTVTCGYACIDIDKYPAQSFIHSLLPLFKGFSHVTIRIVVLKELIIHWCQQFSSFKFSHSVVFHHHIHLLHLLHLLHLYIYYIHLLHLLLGISQHLPCVSNYTIHQGHSMILSFKYN